MRRLRLLHSTPKMHIAEFCGRRNQRIEVRIRYKSNLAKAKIVKYGKGVKIIFRKPQKAITPGQSAVFYKGEELLGGGVIDKVL